MVETAATQQFIDALAVLERERDVERITGLFAPDSEVGNIISPRRFSAVEGARAFWEAHRETFGEVTSTFRNVIVSDGRTAWSGRRPARAPTGHPPPMRA